MKSTAERLRKPSINVPAPPRPARRRPTIESRPTASPVEEPQEIYDDQIDEQEVDNRRSRRGRQNGDLDERTIFRIHQAFYPVGVAYFLSTLGALLITALAMGVPGLSWFQGFGLDFRILFPLIVVIYIPAITRHIRLLNTVYILTDTKLLIESGFFSKSSRNVPLRHIQDVFVSETLKERLIGIGDIIIDTAATEGKISIDNISNPREYADMILDQLQGWD